MTSNSETDKERAAITALYNAWLIDRMGIRHPLHPLDAFSAGYRQAEEAGYQRSVDEYEVQIAAVTADRDSVAERAVDALIGSCTAEDRHGAGKMSFDEFLLTEGVRCGLCVAAERDAALAEVERLRAALTDLVTYLDGEPLWFDESEQVDTMERRIAQARSALSAAPATPSAEDD